MVGLHPSISNASLIGGKRHAWIFNMGEIQKKDDPNIHILGGDSLDGYHAGPSYTHREIQSQKVLGLVARIFFTRCKTLLKEN
jgi:hypothetical protein